MSFPGFPAPPGGGGTPPTPGGHNLLSTTHDDTTAASPVLGDIIVSATGATWDRLAVGAELDHLVIVGGTPTWSAQAGSGLGDVTGPSSSVDGQIALFDGISGKMIKVANATIDSNGNLTVGGDIFGSGDLTILGTSNLQTVFIEGDLSVALDILGSGDLTILGNSNLEDVFVNNNLSVAGNTLVSGDLTVLGNIYSSGLVLQTVSSGTPVTYTIGDTYFNAITSATTGVNLPPSPTTGQMHVVKDIDGTAGTIPITVLGNGNTIDSSATIQLVNNYESATLIFGPTEWNII